MKSGKHLTPFLKWAGGKSQLVSKLMEYLPDAYGTYYEPFIGGGALFLAVMPNRAIINDVNAQLINAYKQIKDNVETLVGLVDQLDGHTCDKEIYLNNRALYNGKIARNELDVETAALMIWCNKHCFNGLYRVNSKGLFNVPYNNKETGSSIDERNILEISDYFNSAQVRFTVGDFEKACETVQAGDFVYFDSPYVPVSKTADFTTYTKDGFELNDHKRLAALFRRLDALGAKLMLSNHNVPLVHELYEGYNIEPVSVRRAINCDASKREGKEVIIRNYT